MEKQVRHIDISTNLERAVESIQYSGKRLLVTLRQELGSEVPDYEKIGEILKMGLTIGYLSEADFRQLRSMFRRHGLPQFTILILEIAAERYPDSLDFKSYLADLYSDSYNTRGLALKYANEILGVTQQENGILNIKCGQIDDDQLIACFNAYIGIKRFDLVVEIGEQLIKQLPAQREIILRNMAISYRKINKPEKEQDCLFSLIQNYPMTDINHYRLGGYYVRNNSYVQAYYQYELASALDTDDTDYLIAIAGLILDARIAWRDNGIQVNLSRAESISYAVPFIYRALEIRETEEMLAECQNFLLRNNLKNEAKDLIQWIQSKPAVVVYPSNLSFSAVEHIRELSSSLSEEYCRQITIGK